MCEATDPREAEVLIQKYVYGQLTAAEASELLTRLKAQPSLGAALLGQMEIDLLLRELTGSMGRNSQPTRSASSVLVPADTLTELPFPAARSPHKWHAWSTELGVTSLAAALALVAGYWFWPEKDNQPQLRRSSAGVEVQRGEERLSATRKVRLQPGDIIETGPGQSAVVEFAREGTRLGLGG